MSEKLYTREQAEVLEEQRQLNERITALNVILNRGQTTEHSDEEWDLLNLQAFNMRGYNYVLSARIRKFNTF